MFHLLGLKSQLVARLSKVLKREEAKEKSGEELEVEDEVEDTAEVITIEDEPQVEEVKVIFFERTLYFM